MLVGTLLFIHYGISYMIQSVYQKMKWSLFVPNSFPVFHHPHHQIALKEFWTFSIAWNLQVLWVFLLQLPVPCKSNQGSKGVSEWVDVTNLYLFGSTLKHRFPHRVRHWIGVGGFWEQIWLVKSSTFLQVAFFSKDFKYTCPIICLWMYIIYMPL